jgi:hypothetical protein
MEIEPSRASLRPPIDENIRMAESERFTQTNSETANLRDCIPSSEDLEENSAEVLKLYKDRMKDLLGKRKKGKSIEEDYKKADYFCSNCNYACDLGKTWKKHLTDKHDGISVSGCTHTYFTLPRAGDNITEERAQRRTWFLAHKRQIPWEKKPTSPEITTTKVFGEGSDVVRGTVLKNP